jgi:alpha-tubulin suppressor-like RCC1 family protein
MPGITTTNFRDSDGVDLGRKLVTKDYLLEVYGTILESSGATGLVVTPELWTWGGASNGSLGTNDVTPTRLTPVTTFAGGTNWKQTTVQAAIKTDGTLWTWGSGGYGQLGINDAIIRSTPVTTFAGGTNWKSVSSTGRFTAAIKTDGSLWVWGINSNGQLGVNDLTNRSTPVTTFAGGNDWKQVSCGEDHTLAVKTDGTLWSWGSGSDGRLGNNNSSRRSTPVTTLTGGTNWKSVSAGQSHSTAIRKDGTLWLWGNNNFGELGFNDTAARNQPTQVLGGGSWKQVFAGITFTAAIKTDGTLWTWGRNSYGQLGNFTTTTRSTPVTTFAGGTNWKQVSASFATTQAIKTDGSLWNWGKDLASNTTTRSIPVTTFLGGNDWKQVGGTAAIRSNDYI